MLTNVSVLYAYLVNGLLTYRWHDRHCRHLLHHDTFFNALFSTHFFQRHFFSLN
jgi:hypothetical protein